MATASPKPQAMAIICFNIFFLRMMRLHFKKGSSTWILEIRKIQRSFALHSDFTHSPSTFIPLSMGISRLCHCHKFIRYNAMYRVLGQTEVGRVEYEGNIRSDAPFVHQDQTSRDFIISFFHCRPVPLDPSWGLHSLQGSIVLHSVKLLVLAGVERGRCKCNILHVFLDCVQRPLLMYRTESCLSRRHEQQRATLSADQMQVQLQKYKRRWTKNQTRNGTKKYQHARRWLNKEACPIYLTSLPPHNFRRLRFHRSRLFLRTSVCFSRARAWVVGLIRCRVANWWFGSRSSFLAIQPILLSNESV